MIEDTSVSIAACIIIQEWNSFLESFH